MWDEAGERSNQPPPYTPSSGAPSWTNTHRQCFHY
jgi:hypothetical protein